MSPPATIDRVVLRNYRSIAECDVALGRLTWLVGRNGAGKSNFLDALHFVRDALNGSLDRAVEERGGFGSVLRRSGGHPNRFDVRLEFTLPDGRRGVYGFGVTSRKGSVPLVSHEAMDLRAGSSEPFFTIEAGELTSSSENTRPILSDESLGLVQMAGLAAFHPAHEMLAGMSFHNFDPSSMREFRRPDSGRSMKPGGSNIASALAYLREVDSDGYRFVQDYLNVIAPMIVGVDRIRTNGMEALEFSQAVPDAERPWSFDAHAMSDGTLRALGILVALVHPGAHGRLYPVGIEEPEAALHPAAVAALREAIRAASEKRQLLLTTHGTDLLDDTDMDPDELRAVAWDRGRTRIVAIDDVASRAMRNHMYSAGELLRQEQLVPHELAAWNIDRTRDEPSGSGA